MGWFLPAMLSKAIPTTGWGIMMGRSMMLSKNFFPGNPRRAKRYANGVPKTSEMKAAAPDVRRLNRMDRTTSRSIKVSFKETIVGCVTISKSGIE
jgi:hypothetical protein